VVAASSSHPASAERRLHDLDIELDVIFEVIE